MHQEMSDRVLLVDKRFRVLCIALAFNGTAALAKIILGIATGLLMVAADGVHSLGDAASNIAGMISLRYARRDPDETYPYGYAKFETIAAFGVSFLLIFAVREILERMYEHWIAGHANPTAAFGTSVFIIMTATTVMGIAVVRYETKRGKELTSDFLIADAAETKSDVLISCAVLGGLGMMKLGLWFADPALAGFIVLLILKSFWQNVKRTFCVLADSAVVPSADIEQAVNAVEGVQFCHAARSRGRPDGFFIDVHIGVLPAMSVAEAHDVISHRVKQTLQGRFPNVQCVTVHIEPDNETARGRSKSVFKEKDY